jgi:hypothetical protein
MEPEKVPDTDAVCCLLSVVCCLLSAACCLLSAVSAVCCVLSLAIIFPASITPPPTPQAPTIVCPGKEEGGKKIVTAVLEPNTQETKVGYPYPSSG